MKKIYYLLGSLQVLTAIGAIPSGTMYLLDTSGARMGTSIDLLINSPMNSYLLPGLFLLFINGLANLAGAYLSFSGNRYAGFAGFILGILLTIWIIIQVAWISWISFLQPLFLVVGIANTVLSWIILNRNQITSS